MVSGGRAPDTRPMAHVDRFAYALGARERTVEESAGAGLTRSPAADLRAAGFARHHVSTPAETAYDLGRAAAERAVAGDAVDALVWASCLPVGQPAAAMERGGDVRDLLEFPALRLHDELGLGCATVVGLAQQACTGMLGAIRLGRALLAGEPTWERVLCVSADRFPEGACYEQAWCLVSDGAAACVVSREPARYRLLAAHHLVEGVGGRPGPDETVGAWFGATHRLVGELAAKAGLAAGEIDWVAPQNTHPAAWRVMAPMLGIDPGRVRAGSQARVGHVTSADALVNLVELQASGDAAPGDCILLTMAGYGLQWQGLLLEVVA